MAKVCHCLDKKGMVLLFDNMVRESGSRLLLATMVCCSPAVKHLPLMRLRLLPEQGTELFPAIKLLIQLGLISGLLVDQFPK